MPGVSAAKVIVRDIAVCVVAAELAYSRQARQIGIVASHSERIIGLYRRHAQTWATKRASQPGRPIEAGWLDQFLKLMPLRADVLDIGCGSGEPIDRYLGEGACSITGVDAAPEMIAICMEAQPRQNWVVADMRTLSLNRTFDGILAWDSFFHLNHDDQRRMFPVFRAHARPQAALMFTTGPGRGEAVGEFEGEPLYHASLDGPEYCDLLHEHGFSLIASRAEDPSCGRHTIWLARCR